MAADLRNTHAHVSLGFARGLNVTEQMGQPDDASDALGPLRQRNPHWADQIVCLLNLAGLQQKVKADQKTEPLRSQVLALLRHCRPVPICPLSEASRTSQHSRPRQPSLTRMYGPAVRRKRFRRVGGERSCINVPASGWAHVLGPSWKSAPAISLADRPQRAIRVTSVRKRREDRSSISSHPPQTSARNPVTSAWARLALNDQTAGWPPQQPCPPRSCGHGENAHAMRAACWQARSPTCGAAASGRLDQGLSPALPVLRPDQHDPGGLNEEHAQVAIAALRYLAEDVRCRRELFGDKTQPGEVAALGERIPGADRRHHRAGDDRPDPGTPSAARKTSGAQVRRSRQPRGTLVMRVQ